MTLKKTLLAGAAGAALFAFAAPVASPAEAGSIKNRSATDLTVYGQVNRAFAVFDDGEDTDYENLDGDNSSTRFGFKATGKVNESVTIGGTLEMEIQSNPANSKSPNEDDFVDGLNERLAYVYFQHKQFGRVTLGQESSISDGMGDGLDLGGAAFAFGGMDPRLATAGGVIFRNENDGSLLSAANEVQDHFKTFDRGRQDLVEYETPSIAGARVEAALYSEGDWGAGVNYDQKFGTVKVRGRAFYENLQNSNNTDGSWMVGASAKHDSGISLTGLYGEQDRASGAARQVWSARVGYTANMNTLGPTGIAINYMGTEDMVNAGDDGYNIGIGFVQQIKAAATQIYGSVNYFDIDLADGTNTDEVIAGLIGARVQF